ncbi:MAG: glycerophosphodiester phosphodiesterase [Candidatus Merdivicinus sp.]
MTEIQAHRGASAECPENTMAAFRRAAELGVKGVELDVYLLPDGNLVVHHDDKLGRCELEAEGSIYEYTAAQLCKMDVGTKFSPDFAGEHIPTFREVLDFLVKTPLFLNVEIKAATGFLTGIEDHVLKLLREYDMEKRSMISSFHHFILTEIRKKYPEMPVGALYSRNYGIDMVEYACKWGFHALHSKYPLVDAELVKRAHEAGLAVNVWTVDQPDDIQRMLDIGVDHIISNNPALAQEIASKQGSPACRE